MVLLLLAEWGGVVLAGEAGRSASKPSFDDWIVEELQGVVRRLRG